NASSISEALVAAAAKRWLVTPHHVHRLATVATGHHAAGAIINNPSSISRYLVAECVKHFESPTVALESLEGLSVIAPPAV
ncbi:MAG: hypothetical protein SFV81_16925, partial [Pirellulaceae bacterium]|nr:hypothetical protein [Pirellulaceae bacterium]